MISVIIPTYKKTDLLIENLKWNLKFLDSCEIIIINDDPKESIQNELSNLPVELIENKKNLGFAGAVNVGIEKAKRDYILLLNNDVRLEQLLTKKNLEPFTENEHLFAIGFAQKEKEGVVGRNRIFFKRGLFLHEKKNSLESGKTAWAEGGAALMKKKVLLELRGFDTLFNPFYWEDIDLSYRAWKLGYTVLFNATFVVEHHHESTIASYYKKKNIEEIAYAHQFIFTWKNIDDKRLLFSHVIWLPYHFLSFGIKGIWTFHKGFFQALKSIGTIREKKGTGLTKRTDKEVLDLFIL